MRSAIGASATNSKHRLIYHKLLGTVIRADQGALERAYLGPSTSRNRRALYLSALI